jgi:hypothetical protein
MQQVFALVRHDNHHIHTPATAIVLQVEQADNLFLNAIY